MRLLNEFHDKVDSIFVLEHVLHVHYEGMLNLEQNVLLKLNILKLLIINYYVLSDALHCIDLSRGLVLYKINFPECAFPNHSHNHEVLKSRLR